ncbi:Rieske 2Fe-2S domain-containing protein [Myxococcota bacterium]|nr:Rieske 2Fe-2S domain-containing protein [Myxococcota bacterium]
MTIQENTIQRFPFGIPLSWYQVAFSDELEPGEVRRLHAFGRNLVMFRGEDGTAGVLDAYCPHLGAHLGEGGEVAGNDLECPFHGWRWHRDGHCTHVPYAKRIPSGARATAYPVCERFGMIFAWFHPRGEPPLYDLPEIPEWRSPGWCADWEHREIELTTHPQEIAENGPDWRHLDKVHDMQMAENDFVFEPDGYGYRWYLGGQVEMGESTLQGVNYGLGLSTFRQGGVHDAIVLTTVTPLEIDRLKFRLSMLSRAPEEEISKQFDYHWAFAAPDFRIWEHKIHRKQPLLCEEDGPIARFRGWAAQFY